MWKLLIYVAGWGDHLLVGAYLEARWEGYTSKRLMQIPTSLKPPKSGKVVTPHITHQKKHRYKEIPKQDNRKKRDILHA